MKLFITINLFQYLSPSNSLNLNHDNFRFKAGQITSALKKQATRRNVLATFSLLTSTPLIANGAPVMTASEADNFSARLERSRRKPAPKLLRPSLNMDFAVLLMRSSYQAMDELDCVAMDQFQKDFFLIRQAEYLPYVDTLGPGLVKQGELSDPYYFDFISFAQYATVNRDITDNPAVVFEEQTPILVGEDDKQEFVATIIRRDPAFIDNALLPSRHDELVGTKILDRLNELFSLTTSAIPSVDRNSDANKIVASLQQMVNLFLINGFAYDGKVGLKKEGKNGLLQGSQIEIVLSSPATLWSGQALQLKKAQARNNFVAKTAKVFLERAGVPVASSTQKYTSTQEITTIFL